MSRSARSHAGFSLIELLVAMLITLVVSGAIFGLMTVGQNAFRREPELADMQQNLRLAVSLLQRDIETAGLGFERFTQVFTPALDNLNFGAGAQFSAIEGHDGEYADGLQMVVGDEACPGVTTCFVSAAAPYTVQIAVPPPDCLTNAVLNGVPLAVVGTTGIAAPFFSIATPSASAVAAPTCPANSSPSGWTFTVPIQGSAAWSAPGAPPGISTIGPARVIRYVVAPDPTDPIDPTAPCLWRSETGGGVAGDGYVAVTAPPSAAWQMVARGIEDLQVTYMDGGGVYSPTVTAVVPGGFATLTSKVMVIVSARSLAPNLQGMTLPPANAGAPGLSQGAVRSRLVGEVSPRAALLGQAGQTWR